ncbi:MAG: hypothetical protein ACRCVN_01455 [Spirochaetia bacterium]
MITLAVLIGCSSPTTRSRQLLGQADHSGGIANVGTDTSLAIPTNFAVENNGTGTDKFLKLSWTPVAGATGYRVYRAIYPTIMHKTNPQDQEFKLLQELTQPFPLPTKIDVKHNIPEVPLRRYAYYVTATRYYGESNFSQMITGWRVPVDEVEALRDLDYTVHFAQTRIPKFGEMNLDEIVNGRGGGTYHFTSKITKMRSDFKSYCNFEVILNGTPKMAINMSPIGTKMNGETLITGLYNARTIHKDFLGTVGGLSAGGQIVMEYDHPTRGLLKRAFDYKEASRFMRSVALTADEIYPAPPRREWDESDSSYVRTRALKFKDG